MKIRTLFILLIMSSGIASAVEPKNIHKTTGLIIASGWELVKTNCTSCHSAKIISSQQSSKNGWLKTIQRMQNQQGLKQLKPATEEKILAYLASNYAIKKTARRASLPAAALPNNPWKKCCLTKQKVYKIITIRKNMY